MANDITGQMSLNNVANTRKAAPLKPLEPYEYPYSLMGKIRQFPFKFYWKQGRMVRYVAAGIFLTLIFEYKIHKAAREPTLVKEYREGKLNELITFFDFDPKASRQGKAH